jgi:hypothetical protein
LTLIAAKSKEIDNLISNALEKLGGIEADTTSDNNE